MHTPSWRTALLGLTCATCMAAAPLLAQTVNTDYDHKANFTSFHTFSFYKVQTNDPFYQQRLKDDIAAELQKDGLQQVPSGGALAITAIGGVKDKEEYNTFYTGLGPGFGWGGWGGWWGGRWGGGGETQTTEQAVPVGTLMVDLYDTRNHNLVFRGTAHSDLKSNSDKNIKLVQKTVDKMFDKYPAKHS